MGIQEWMGGKKVLERGDEKSCIMDVFIFIREVRFFIYNNFRMFIKELLIVECDGADNPQPSCDNTDL